MKRRKFILTSAITLSGIHLLIKKFTSSPINSTTMHKKVAQKHDLRFKQAFPGLKGVDIMAHTYPIEPFLVFTEFLMDRPGFGPHPHAGISVMTYMLPDSQQGFINRDSQGDFSHIEPGGMHIMQAGSGMLHDEFPKTTGIETHGFQIWINHAAKNRMVAPTSMHAGAAEIPEKTTEDYRIRIIHGAFEGIKPGYQMVTDVNLYHVFLEPNKSIVLNAMPMAFVYGLKGKGNTDGATIHAQTLINFTLDSEKAIINASEEGLEFMFATGTPHNEAITYGGPFVMTTKEQMAETQRRYANGEMGFLEPYKG